MQSHAMRRQRGQSMTEFLVAMAAIVPLFLGIVYVGKFVDIKHQAVQASRFAAFERAMDPDSTHESLQVLQEETRARFFTDGARNQGKIGFQDSTSGLATSGTTNAAWYQLNGTPLLQNYSGIQVNASSNSMDVGSFTAVNQASRVFSNLNRNGQIQADVVVPISNIASLPAPLNNLNLNVAARTVVAGDTWEGSSSRNVADQQTFATDWGKNPVLQGFKALLAPLALVFTDDGSPPQFGCVRPDVVPQQTAPGASYKGSDPCL
ncbi:MAG TPA: hypothetical protein VLX90_13130 [Steroidobacteraceae bacterium]|nr:hypothetical protein [Steroidobacteraceae bacterium]